MTGDPTKDRSRSEARERAIELAYEAEMRSWTVDELLESLTLEPDEFAVGLLRNVESTRSEVDRRIEDKATGWTLARMPVMDRIVMRMAVAELLHRQTPMGVVLAEAVELASRYSTDESSRFVNGVLAAIADDLTAVEEA